MPKLGSFGTGSTKSLGFQGFRPPSPSGQATAVYPATIASNSTGLTNTNTGTFTWTAPAYVTKVNIVMVGGGGGGGGLGKNSGGGGGGSLTYANNIPVNAGVTYSITVGGGGAVNTDGEKTWFNNSTYLFANGGSKGTRNDSDATFNETFSGANYLNKIAGNSSETIGSGAISSGTLGWGYRYAWTCPTGVWRIHVVCVGAGGGGSASNDSTLEGGSGGQGGTLAWRNEISVIPGRVYNLEVGMTFGISVIGGDSCFYDLIELSLTAISGGTNLTITGSDVSKLVINAYIIFAGDQSGILTGKKYIIADTPTFVNSTTYTIRVKDRWGAATLTSFNPANITLGTPFAAQSTTTMASGGAPATSKIAPTTHSGGGILLGQGGGYGGNSRNSFGVIASGGGGAGGYGGTSPNFSGGAGGIGGAVVSPTNLGVGTTAMYFTVGSAGSGGGGGGGSSGSFHQSTVSPATVTAAARMAGACGGGVGLLGQGTSGDAAPTPLWNTPNTTWNAAANTPASTTYSGNPGSGGAARSTSSYPTLSGPTGGFYAYGAGQGGGSVQSNSLGNIGEGAVRIIYGANRSFPATNTGTFTISTYSTYGFQGGGGGGAAGYSSSGGTGGTYALGSTTGGAGGVAFSGTIAGATIVSNAGGAGGNANNSAGVTYVAATNPGGGAAAGGSGGSGPFGGGGVGYLGLQALNQDSANNTTTPGAATANGSSALVTTNGGSKGGSGTGGNTGTGTGGTGGGGGPGGGWGGSGGPGFLRITWGEGRSYPDILTMDLFQAGNFTSGLSYTIARLGSTTQAQWNILGGTTGSPITYNVGTVFTPTSTITGSYGSGTAYRS